MIKTDFNAISVVTTVGSMKVFDFLEKVKM